MKRKILSALMVLVLTVLVLTSCFGGVADEGDVTVVIENRDGSCTEYVLALEKIENKSEGVTGLLEQLSSRDTDPLSLDLQSGPYGKYINSIGSLTPDALAGEYIGIYTSVEADFDTSAYVKELTYNGTSLKTSGVGISSMQVPKDAIILFKVEAYTG